MAAMMDRQRERFYGRLWRLTPHDDNLLDYYERQGNRREIGEVINGQGVASEVADDWVHVGGNGASSADPEKAPLITVDIHTPGVSQLHCAINIVKCAIGAGSFNVPYAFQREGLWMGIIGTLALGLLGAYTIILLARAEKYVVLHSSTHRRCTYPEVARHLFPGLTLRGVNLLELLVYSGMVLASVGVCAIYAVVILEFMPAVNASIKREYVAIVAGGLMLAMALIRTYSWLAITSVLGDVAVTAGIVAAVAYGLRSNSPSMEGVPSFNVSQIPQSSSVIAFLFLIHAVVLPMAQSLDGDMQHPKRFDRVVWRSTFFITSINLFFGVICVLVFGAETKSNIIDNLGTSAVVKIVRVLLCLDLLFTVPMVLAFGREILEKTLLRSGTVRHLSKRKKLVISSLLRAFMVGVVMSIALGVLYSKGGQNAFFNLINLVGGGLNFMIGLVLPPLFHLKTQKLNNSLTYSSLLTHGFIIILGLVLFVSSTYYTIRSFMGLDD